MLRTEAFKYMKRSSVCFDSEAVYLQNVNFIFIAADLLFQYWLCLFLYIGYLLLLSLRRNIRAFKHHLVCIA